MRHPRSFFTSPFALTPVLAALALLLGVAAPAAAQVRIIPQVGLWTPRSDLPSAGDAVEVGERESTLAFGVAVELGSAAGTSFRVGALHGTNSEFPVGDVGCTDCSARSSVTTLTGTVVLRPIDLVVARPYILLGGGLRRMDFDREDLEEEEFDALFSDENDIAGHVGLGVELSLPVLHLNVELSDVVSPLDGPGDESEIQHDLFLTVGLIIG